MPHPNVGDPAPDFELPDQDGTLVKLSDLRDKRTLVLFFYPKNFTPGCTQEACAFRDQYEVFLEAGAQVVGISADPPERHIDFKTQYRLPFPLLSDPDNRVRKLFGVKSTLGILPGRVTFVIDPSGTIRRRFSSQLNPQAHIKETLATVKNLNDHP